jgi:hypothetical protein
MKTGLEPELLKGRLYEIYLRQWQCPHIIRKITDVTSLQAVWEQA